MATIKHLVSVSEQSFFCMIMSALEAYQLGQSGTNSTIEPVEIYGNLWGYTHKTTRGENLIRVIMADMDYSAEGDNGQVTPNPSAIGLKSDFVDSFFPELLCLGDYHSHPYDRSEVNSELAISRNKYQKLSKGDRRLASFNQKAGRNHVLQIIVTVFENNSPSTRKDGPLAGDTSCLRFRFKNHTIWLQAHMYSDKGYRKISDNQLALLCPTLGSAAFSIENHGGK